MTRRTLPLPLLLTALCLLAGALTARAQGGDHRAPLVVRFADNSLETRCVAFSEPSITGVFLFLSWSDVLLDSKSLAVVEGLCAASWLRLRFPHSGLLLPLPRSDL